MKFSLFYEMQIPDPTRESEATLFRECVDQAVLADRRDYRCVWAGVDELILVMQMGPVPNELVTESVKTFGEQVLTHFI